MRLSFNSETRFLLEVIQQELPINQTVYLVGGAVRDALLERQIHDLDFAMAEAPISLAKMVARRLQADFFVLDDNRHTARVLYHNPNGELSPLDFVQFTGEGLMVDLENRDFTVNAMAISLGDLSTLIDPLGGQADLTLGLLKPCSPHALLDDPVRVLRGIRLAIEFDFNFVPGLSLAMTQAAAHLSKTSFERQRDEFFKILEGKNPSLGVANCWNLDVFKTLIPPLVEQTAIPASPPQPLPLMEHTLKVLRYLEYLLDTLKPDSERFEDAPWWLIYAQGKLLPFAEQISDFFGEEITPGRTKRGLALFGALLHDIGKPRTMKADAEGQHYFEGHDIVGSELAWEAAKRIQLSNAESDWVRTLVRYHLNLLPMVHAQGAPSRREIYRFYKETGDTGLAIGLLSLADLAATYEDTLPRSKWEQAVLVTTKLFSAWWKERELVISPALLLDGNELQAEFGLAPGKQIGQLLEELAEAQASGDVDTKQQACAFIEHRLADLEEGA